MLTQTELDAIAGRLGDDYEREDYMIVAMKGDMAALLAMVGELRAEVARLTTENEQLSGALLPFSLFYEAFLDAMAERGYGSQNKAKYAHWYHWFSRENAAEFLLPRLKDVRRILGRE